MPKTSIVDLTDDQRADVLEFLFHGRFTSDLRALPSIEGLDRGVIMRSMTTAGLVKRLRGAKSGTVYSRTMLGTIVLAALQDRQEIQEEANE